MSRDIMKWTSMAVAFAIFAVAVALPTASASGQQAPDTEEINAKIREEGWENSQVMRTLHFFTDRYGPRLSGSPNHENAAKWAIEQMADWGFSNAHLEGFDFGRPGWLNERFAVHMISPIKDPLVGEVLLNVADQLTSLFPEESGTLAVVRDNLAWQMKVLRSQ